MSEAGLGQYRERRPFKDTVWCLWEVSSGRARQVAGRGRMESSEVLSLTQPSETECSLALAAGRSGLKMVDQFRVPCEAHPARVFDGLGEGRKVREE